MVRPDLAQLALADSTVCLQSGANIRDLVSSREVRVNINIQININIISALFLDVEILKNNKKITRYPGKIA